MAVHCTALAHECGCIRLEQLAPHQNTTLALAVQQLTPGLTLLLDSAAPHLPLQGSETWRGLMLRHCDIWLTHAYACSEACYWLTQPGQGAHDGDCGWRSSFRLLNQSQHAGKWPERKSATGSWPSVRLNPRLRQRHPTTTSPPHHHHHIQQDLDRDMQALTYCYWAPAICGQDLPRVDRLSASCPGAGCSL